MNLAAIAAEHVAWCRSRGMTPADIVASVGLPVAGASSWDDAHMAVEHAAAHLPPEAAHRFAAPCQPEARQIALAKRPARVDAAKRKKRRGAK